MNKFKAFFTHFSFYWLWCCGFWALYQGVATGKIAWFGLLLNAWALPLWMLLRFRNPQKFSGDQRETPAFATVLAGLALTLLTDIDRGLPVYLAIVNLFAVLIYLFHLTALKHPAMPAVDREFPSLATVDGKEWDAAGFCRRQKAEGLLLVFLRGSFCADSRAQLTELAAIEESLRRHRIRPVLLSTESVDHWRHLWRGESMPEIVQLCPSDERNRQFVAAGGAPLWPLRPGRAVPGGSVRGSACRPSCWLLDEEAFVIWRYLPDNYRLPGSGEFIRGQLVRLQG